MTIPRPPKKPFSDPQRPSTWVRYRSGLCDGCWAGCCTLPLEVSLADLIRLELITEDEAATHPPATIAKRLKKERWIERFHHQSGIFIIAQKGGRDCLFLGEDRRCTVYEKRPAVCREFPKIGPRPGFCPGQVQSGSSTRS